MTSFVATFFFEKTHTRSLIHGKEYNDVQLLAKAELYITLKKENYLFSIKRVLSFDAFPDVEDIRWHLQEIISEINKYYNHPICDAGDPTCADIILPAGIGGIFVHEAIGHCLEADLYCKKTTS